MTELAAFMRGAADQHAAHWSKTAREPGAETALAQQAVERLLALNLVRRCDGGIQARPALLRYAFEGPDIRGAAEPAQAALL
jgi:hypothetical protein